MSRLQAVILMDDGQDGERSALGNLISFAVNRS
jgi:hypothetical protein